jgi:hypothetical protein
MRLLLDEIFKSYVGLKMNIKSMGFLALALVSFAAAPPAIASVLYSSITDLAAPGSGSEEVCDEFTLATSAIVGSQCQH